ncbi:tRNA pseudouridine(55) synthase TruB [Aquifex aeolicus]|uniref:tRNA pseudouridine synthase B n=1 Tax=Aquifex aeolicus (strain VF5) TaxID=224324 RepID=TRUB_AQUAE|nr:tRNA pseudouridine(55) synthase TruB [Aquifex aeolicus]O66922.1 RecName: Full=tRNA pseudouridine synthase B; AltName: Full=tRNA pseudouridine(55) synthase; Short=Psi55 synthase; AltName: Full=tRNA pseudouridylate synthase; AltName: Full=tRNA-uridine isomerase [Aquifex aeolicus VF5]AAC06885.1 tRNA pseudouridine 55 synthase [Aquifex aeolicus VF5]
MDGALLIDKPKGITSTEVVERVKEKLKARKAGHTGTLDPIATGLLIILINKATRFSQFFIGMPKTYRFTVKFGAETDTYDAQGKVVETYEGELNCDKLKEVLNEFRGEILQTPPPFSAKKIKGRRAYELARKGKKVELKPVKITVYSLELLSCNPREKEAEFLAEISSGGYVRSLAYDIGKKLGIGGYMKELRRLKIDEISVEEAVSLEEFLSSENPEEYVLPVDTLFRVIPEVRLNTFEAGKILQGKRILIKNYDYEGLVKIYEDSKFIGIGELKGGVLSPKRLLV